MISVFTISRQYGSGGSRLAQQLAVATGYDLIWREIINQAALRIGAPDVALAMIDEFDFFGLCPDESTCLAYKQALDTIIHQLADRGNCILVGRASHMVLNDRPEVLRVRVIASKETRIQNICRTKSVNDIAANAQIEQSDHYRTTYLKKFYNSDWSDPGNFDLTINTDQLKIDEIVDVLTTFTR